MVLSRGSEITKTTQILRYLLSFDDNGKMNRTKLIKLLWAADRYHVRHYGRLVSEGNYVAMRFGPVASLALDVAQVKNDFAFDKDDIEYIGYYLSADEKDTMATAAKIADDHLSETDKEALQWAWDTFGKKDALKISLYLAVDGAEKRLTPKGSLIIHKMMSSLCKTLVSLQQLTNAILIITRYIPFLVYK